MWRRATAVLAVTVLALLVAALVRRPAPDFATRRVIAVVGGADRPLWALRLAPGADELDAAALRPPPVAAGHVYQLWLVDGGRLRQIGLLPQTGDKLMPLTPENTLRLGGRGRLAVTLEPAGGWQGAGPPGPVLFRARLE